MDMLNKSKGFEKHLLVVTAGVHFYIFLNLSGVFQTSLCVCVCVLHRDLSFLRRQQAVPLPRVLGGGQLSGPPSSHFQLRLWESGGRGSVPQGWLISHSRPRRSHPASWSRSLNIIRPGWWIFPPRVQKTMALKHCADTSSMTIFPSDVESLLHLLGQSR